MASYGWDDTARALGLGPTLFAYDISRMIAGVLFMGAAGYGLMRGVHIRADFLYRNWTEKTQATVDAFLYMAFFIPSMIFFTIIAAQYWELAYRTGETAFDSPWEPLLWPARLAMPVGGLLLTLQGIPELFRAFHKMGKERERRFVQALPFYILALIWLIMAVFAPRGNPGRRLVYRYNVSPPWPVQTYHRFDHACSDDFRDLHRFPDFIHVNFPSFCIWYLGIKL